MIYLLISIVFMAAIAPVFRLGADRQADPLGVNLVFRVSAGLVYVAALAFVVSPSRWPGMMASIGMHGAVAAVCFWLAGYAAIKAVHSGHLGVTWIVTRVSMVIPTLASILYWREVTIVPLNVVIVLRASGLVVAVAAIAMLGVDQWKLARRRKLELADTPEPASDAAHRSRYIWPFWLTCSFLSQGSWEITLRATRSLPDDDSRLMFMGMVFIGAGLLSVPVMLAARPRLGRREFGFGAMAGVCSLVGSGVRPFALRDIDGVIVFPVTTICVMLLVLTIGAIFWRERVGKLGLLGTLAAIAGVVLLTVRV